jgi:hypothetical protein
MERETNSIVAAPDESLPKAVPDFKIRSATPRGFWRAGIFWGPEEVVVVGADREKFDVLCAEPMLVVTVLQE